MHGEAPAGTDPERIERRGFQDFPIAEKVPVHASTPFGRKEDRPRKWQCDSQAKVQAQDLDFLDIVYREGLIGSRRSRRQQ